MGVDIAFYIQKRENNEWKNVFLYAPNMCPDMCPVGIWRCGGDAFHELQRNWKTCRDNIDELTKETGWTIEDDDAGYWASLAKIKYFAEKNEDRPRDFEEEEDYFDRKAFYKELEREIDAYLTFSGNDFLDMDNIRIIAFVSY